MLPKGYYQQICKWLCQILRRPEEEDRRTRKEQAVKQKLASDRVAIYARVATLERVKVFRLRRSKIGHSWSMANKLTRQALSQELAQALGD